MGEITEAAHKAVERVTKAPFRRKGAFGKPPPMPKLIVQNPRIEHP
jgi:hypothetical protein